MAGQRAAMQAARQLTAAGQRANVLDFYAATLVAAVFAAKAFLKLIDNHSNYNSIVIYCRIDPMKRCTSSTFVTR